MFTLESAMFVSGELRMMSLRIYQNTPIPWNTRKHNWCITQFNLEGKIQLYKVFQPRYSCVAYGHAEMLGC